MEFLIALFLFTALVACWCMLPGQSSTVAAIEATSSDGALDASAVGHSA